jgi:predicted CxxxxCH...CXXCH cytochrome family protein
VDIAINRMEHNNYKNTKMNRIKVFYTLLFTLTLMSILSYIGCSEVRDDIVVNSSDLSGCSLCHGNAEHPYPPRSLSGQVEPTYLGVGSHESHLNPDSTERFSRKVDCSECHDPVTHFNDPSHIGPNPDNRAEIIFGSLARNSLPGDSIPHPIYDGNGKCSNVYCHGNFRQGNRNAQPVFNNPGSVVCGSCHGDPAMGNPTPGAPNNFQSPHFSFYTIQFCANCHGSVIDSSGSFVNKSRHVNGQVDLNF